MERINWIDTKTIEKVLYIVVRKKQNIVDNC